MTETSLPYQRCSCDTTRLCRRTLSNQSYQWVYQCVICGRQVRVIKSTSPEVLACSYPAPTWDHALVERWDAERRAQSEARAAQYQEDWKRKQREQQEEQEKQQREWWSWYKSYLETDTWRRKRQAVLERDKHICQACLSNHASQVHHLNYKHVGDEPLFDLIAVCGRCHKKLHQQEEVAS